MIRVLSIVLFYTIIGSITVSHVENGPLNALLSITFIIAAAVHVHKYLRTIVEREKRKFDEDMKNADEVFQRFIKQEFERMKASGYTQGQRNYSYVNQNIKFPEKEFKLLGLSPQASVEDIRKQYRKLAIKAHPDRGGSNEQFNQLTIARDKCISFKENQL